MTPPVSVDAARAAVQAAARPLPAAVDEVSPALLGRRLAEDVRADADSPPFAKSLRDGFAVRAADLPSGVGTLTVVGELVAGGAFAGRVGAGEAVAIATGAPIPDGADAVVMVEQSRRDGGRVQLNDPAVKPGQHVFPCGAEFRAGDVVLPAGATLTPVALAMLAAVGRTSASVIPAPRVGILPTGDELLEPGEPLAPGKIRNTNGPLLAGLVQAVGAVPVVFPKVPDRPDALQAAVRDALSRCDVLLLTGGVSVGPLDLVPNALTVCGVETRFHRVRVKPGAPLLFGTRGDQLVFGLPGNPGGVLVAFALLVRPTLDLLAGREPSPWPPAGKPLAEAFAASNDRPTFHPARTTPAGVAPLPWGGSADLRAYLSADCLLALPAGEVCLAAGDVVPVLPLP